MGATSRPRGADGPRDRVVCRTTGPPMLVMVALDETPDLYGAFPRLTAAQVQSLSAMGVRRDTQEGEVLYREGDLQCDFYVILAGRVAVVEDHGGPNEHVIGVHGPGRFLGELSLLTGQAVFVTAVVLEAGAVLVVPTDGVRRLVVQDPSLGNVILRAYLLRRSLMIGWGAGFRIVGSRYSPATMRLREFADRNRLPHRWIDLDADPQAESLLADLGVRPDETPVVIWRGETVLRNPSPAELARLVGLRQAHPCEGLCDLLVVGAGPAGLAAAVYGASEGLTTVMLDAVASGGQAGSSPQIENYLGFPLGIPGTDLAERAAVQAEKFGARLSVPAEAVALERHEAHYVVTLDDGEALHSRTVVIATGARYRRLDVPRLEEFEGTSVYHAATHVEAQLCHMDPVVVVGGGNSAGQAAMYMAGHAKRVYLLVRADDLGRSMSRYLAQRIEQCPDVEVLLNTEVRELQGDRVLEGVVVEDRRTGERRVIEARALFVFIGADPHTGWLGDQVARDDHGFVLTGATSLETNLPGVFAAGDVRSGSIKRVAAAVGEGATAIRQVHSYFEWTAGQPTRHSTPAQ